MTRPGTLPLLGILALLAALLAVPPDAGAVSLRLRDGSFLHGEIADSDDAGILFRRWDNGGVLRIAWGQLAVEEIGRVRNLVRLPEENTEFMIDGVRLTKDDTTEVEGVIVEEPADRIVVHTTNGNKTIPKKVLVSRKAIQLQGLLLFSADELYAQQIARLNPEGNAPSQLEMGRFCIQIHDYARAKDHLEKALALDATLEPQIKRRLELVSKRLLEQGGAQLVQEIRSLIEKRDFEAARQKLDELKKDYAASAASTQAEGLADSIEKGEQNFEDVQQNVYTKKITEEWRTAMLASIKQVAGEKTATLADARDYVEKALGDELRQKVCSKMQIKEDAFDKIWKSRSADKTYMAYYQDGTFIVDPASEQEIMEKAAAGGFKNIGKLRNAPAILDGLKNNGSEDTKEAWWKAANTAKRQAWLEAYAAEKLMEVSESKKDPCRACKGQGVSQKPDLCAACRGKGSFKIIVYK